MSWYYRAFKVIPKKLKGQPKNLQPEPYWCVKEFYNSWMGKGWSKDPMSPQGSPKKELIQDLEMMLDDIKKRKGKVEDLSKE